MNKQNKYFMLLDDGCDKTEKVIELLKFKSFSYTKQITSNLEVRLIISHIGWRSNWNLTNVEAACKLLLNDINEKKVKYELKGGISNGPDYRKAGDKYFDFTCYISDCESIIENSTSEVECFNKFLELSKKKSTETCIANLFHLFLPLDIDMQALADKKVNKKEYLQEMSNNLEVLYRLKKYDSKNINHHYQQKLYDLWYLLRSGIRNKELLVEIEKHASSELKNLTPIDNPSNELLVIAGINNKNPKASRVYKFFESLDARKVEGKDLAEAVDYLCKPFINIKIKGNDDITTFHDWYCALAKCLRNENKS